MCDKGAILPRFSLVVVEHRHDEEVLGRPQQAGTASDGIEVFRYVQVGGRVGETSCYGVIFKNGEVTDYGPETGVRLGGHYAIHELFSSDWQTNLAAPKP